MNNEIMNKLPENVTRTAGRAGLFLKKYSPDILFVAGLVGGVVAAVMGAKAHKRAEEALAVERYDIEYLNEEVKPLVIPEDKEMVQDYRKNIVDAYVKYGIGIAKVYGPSVALGIASVTSLVGSHGLMQRRAASIMAAYGLLQEGFATYRERVVEELGEEKDHDFRFGITEEEVEREEINPETGRKKKIKERVKKVADETSDYAKFFDHRCADFKLDPYLNQLFLKQRQAYANDEFKIRGHMFLNEVYDMLDIPRTAAGAMVGWVYDEKNPIGDNFIDFGIVSTKNSAFINGYDPVALLDFNVDGIIFDLI